MIVEKRRVDFLTEEKTDVEIKTMAKLSDKELYQGLNYPGSHKPETGLSIKIDAKGPQRKCLVREKNFSNPLPNPESL